MIDNNTELLKLDGNLTSGNVDVQHVVWVIYWKHTVTHCHGQGHWLRIDLICMFLMIKNTEHPQETHSKTWSTSKHRRAAPQLRCEPRSFLCEATVLTTAPTGRWISSHFWLNRSSGASPTNVLVRVCLSLLMRLSSVRCVSSGAALSACTQIQAEICYDLLQSRQTLRNLSEDQANLASRLSSLEYIYHPHPAQCVTELTKQTWV